MPVTEPSTLLTDYLLAMVCTWCGIRLLRQAPATRLLWALGYLCLAASALTGGTFHGFRELLPAGVVAGLWHGTLVGIGAGAGFIASGILVQRTDAAVGGLKAAGIITLGAFLLLGLRVGLHPQFNHNDLYHVLQLGALIVLYRAIRPRRRSRSGGAIPERPPAEDNTP